jgi:hypothetical protein
MPDCFEVGKPCLQLALERGRCPVRAEDMLRFNQSRASGPSAPGAPLTPAPATLPGIERCTRCRTLAVARCKPELTRRLLEKGEQASRRCLSECPWVVCLFIRDSIILKPFTTPGTESEHQSRLLVAHRCSAFCPLADAHLSVPAVRHRLNDLTAQQADEDSDSYSEARVGLRRAKSTMELPSASAQARAARRRSIDHTRVDVGRTFTLKHALEQDEEPDSPLPETAKDAPRSRSQDHVLAGISREQSLVRARRQPPPPPPPLRKMPSGTSMPAPVTHTGGQDEPLSYASAHVSRSLVGPDRHDAAAPVVHVHQGPPQLAFGAAPLMPEAGYAAYASQPQHAPMPASWQPAHLSSYPGQPGMMYPNFVEMQSLGPPGMYEQHVYPGPVQHLVHAPMQSQPPAYAQVAMQSQQQQSGPMQVYPGSARYQHAVAMPGMRPAPVYTLPPHMQPPPGAYYAYGGMPSAAEQQGGLPSQARFVQGFEGYPGLGYVVHSMPHAQPARAPPPPPRSFGQWPTQGQPAPQATTTASRP